MYANTQLRDAFNREMLPNRGQPGASSFGGIGGGGGNFASYQPSGVSEWGPESYSLQDNSYGGLSNGGLSNGGLSNGGYSGYGNAPSDCSSCDLGPQYSQQLYGQTQYGQHMPQQHGSQPQFYSQAVDQSQLYSQHQPVHQPLHQTDYIASTHSSVNNMLVKYLKESLVYISEQLGVEPDWVDLSPDGGASWKYSSMVNGNSLWCRVFTKVEIHAERKGSKNPVQHIANLTTTTRVKLDIELVKQLQCEFPMVSYCPNTRNLTITMDTLEHNLAVLALICACQQGKIDLDKIKYNNLPKKYLLLTTPGHKRYHRGAKYSLVRLIRK